MKLLYRPCLVEIHKVPLLNSLKKLLLHLLMKKAPFQFLLEAKSTKNIVFLWLHSVLHGTTREAILPNDVFLEKLFLKKQKQKQKCLKIYQTGP